MSTSYSSTNRAYKLSSYELKSMNSEELDSMAVDLRDELLRLRDSTQSVIHDCWEEVENLKEEKDEHISLIEQLRIDLRKSQQVNDDLRVWIGTHCSRGIIGPPRHIEEKDGQAVWKSFPQQIFKWKSRSDESALSENTASRPRVSRGNAEKSDGCSMQYSHTKTQSTGDCSTLASSITEEKDEYIHKLEQKISARDAAIESLEDTIGMQLTMMKPDNSKEKDFTYDQSHSLGDTIASLESEVKSLQQKVQDQQEMIFQRNSTIFLNQEHVDNLANELEYVVDVIKTFESQESSQRASGHNAQLISAVQDSSKRAHVSNDQDRSKHDTQLIPTIRDSLKRGSRVQ